MLQPVQWASMSTIVPILSSILSTLQGSTFITYSTYWSICLQNLSKLLMGWKKCFTLPSYREAYLAHINYARGTIGWRHRHNFSRKNKNIINGNTSLSTTKMITHSSKIGMNSSKWTRFCLGTPNLRSQTNRNLSISCINNSSVLLRRQPSKQLKAVLAPKIMKLALIKESSTMDQFLSHSLRTILFHTARVRMVK